MIPTMLFGWVLVVTVVLPSGPQTVAVDYPTRTSCEAALPLIDSGVAPRCVPRNDHYKPRAPREVPATQQSAYPWRNP